MRWVAGRRQSIVELALIMGGGILILLHLQLRAVEQLLQALRAVESCRLESLL